MTGSSATIPVTVIGGFLGAGKTTFVNHLLATGAPRTAVLVNDFGEINIDASLIQRHDGATMSLSNGCICCSIGGGFIETMGRVLDSETRFDHIVIEASGVGDPWRIAEIALIEPTLRLDRVVVVADASRIAALLTDARVGDTVRGQFARCDIVLLNKSDLIDADGLEAARRTLIALRPDLRIVATSRMTMPSLTALTGGPTSGALGADAPSLEPHDHGDEFRSWAYRREGAFDRARFEGALAELPPQLLRLKGSCRLAGDDDVKVLQMVDRIWTLSPSVPNQSSMLSGIVLVGVGTRNLPSPAALDEILDRALVSPDLS